MEVVHEFPGGLIMSWTTHPRGLAGFEDRDRGCVFQGSQGTLLADYTSHELFVKGKRVTEFQRPPQSIPDSPGHVREFLDSIKSRNATTCNIGYAYQLTKAGLLGNIAYRTGRRLRWDDGQRADRRRSRGAAVAQPALSETVEARVSADAIYSTP